MLAFFSFFGGCLKELFENLHEEVCMVITSIKLYIFISSLMILPCEDHNNIRMVKIFVVVAGCMFM